MQKSVSIALLTSVAVIIPAGAAFAATQSSSKSATTKTTIKTAAKPTVKKAAKKTAKKTTTVTTHKYVGPGVDMQWGTVQVTIVVKGKIVTDLSATAPTERARSAYINSQAVPMLRQEVLQAKTVAKIKNIYGISGATMTSEAFYQSLLSALHSAKLM